MMDLGIKGKTVFNKDSSSVLNVGLPITKPIHFSLSPTSTMGKMGRVGGNYYGPSIQIEIMGLGSALFQQL